MALNEVLAHIDGEIAKLQQARALLTGGSTPEHQPAKAGRGRPKGSKNAGTGSKSAAPASKSVGSAGKTKRKLSPEGRKAIADAMKRRWAERRKADGK